MDNCRALLTKRLAGNLDIRTKGMKKTGKDLRNGNLVYKNTNKCKSEEIECVHVYVCQKR